MYSKSSLVIIAYLIHESKPKENSMNLVVFTLLFVKRYNFCYSYCTCRCYRMLMHIYVLSKLITLVTAVWGRYSGREPK